jgi:hypothetical protein
MHQDLSIRFRSEEFVSSVNEAFEFDRAVGIRDGFRLYEYGVYQMDLAMQDPSHAVLRCIIPVKSILDVNLGH